MAMPGPRPRPAARTCISSAEPESVDLATRALAVYAEQPADEWLLTPARDRLSGQFEICSPEQPHELALVRTANCWELRDPRGKTVIRADFVEGASAHRRRFGGGRGQSIARACGLKSGKTPNIVDATAGLGRDAFVLASLGCEVQLFERSPLVSILLADALERARACTETRHIADRMQLMEQDARTGLIRQAQQGRAETIYLDPMFPQRRKSAAVKKEMRCFQRIVGDDEDSAGLLETALNCGAQRVVVKRPAKSPALAAREPDAVIAGKTTRFDLYFPAS